MWPVCRYNYVDETMWCTVMNVGWACVLSWYNFIMGSVSRKVIEGFNRAACVAFWSESAIEKSQSYIYTIRNSNRIYIRLAQSYIYTIENLSNRIYQKAWRGYIIVNRRGVDLFKLGMRSRAWLCIQEIQPCYFVCPRRLEVVQLQRHDPGMKQASEVQAWPRNWFNQLDGHWPSIRD